MVSIIILTYNSENYIENLLESIVKFNKNSNYEIIIVDNNSEDETVKLIQKSPARNATHSVAGGKFKIIENKENLGFSKGINIGVKEARGEFLLFINPDTEWERGSISELLSVFDRNEKIGIIGGKLIGKNGIGEKSAGKFLGFWASFITAFGLDEALRIRFSPNKTCRVDFVSGGFMAVRKKVFDSLSGFDENLFMYIEDAELCFRAKKAGYLTYFVPAAVLVHEGHGSSNRGFAIKNIYRGLLYFHKKHGTPISYSSVKVLLWAKALALVSLGKIINNKYLTATYSEALKI